MELRHLRYFIAMADTEHVGRAARRVGIVQPALSRQLRQLEEELGVPLLERAGRRLRLTAAGSAFAADARRTLEDVARAAERARRAARGEIGRLTVGFVETALWDRGPLRLLERYRRRHPGVQLALVPASSRAQWTALREETIDAGLAYHLPPGGGDLQAAELAREPVVLALPRRHALARRARLRLADLAGARWVWFPRAASPAFHDDVARALAGARVALEPAEESADAATRLSLVAAGLGVTFTGASARRRRPDDVVIREVADLDVALTLHLLWRRGDGSPHVAALVALSRETQASGRDRRASRPRPRRAAPARR
jgi:DNA-binding transcriptional LysR family regulator